VISAISRFDAGASLSDAARLCAAALYVLCLLMHHQPPGREWPTHKMTLLP
jgi:hypothetical protein